MAQTKCFSKRPKVAENLSLNKICVLYDICDDFKFCEIFLTLTDKSSELLLPSFQFHRIQCNESQTIRRLKNGMKVYLHLPTTVSSELFHCVQFLKVVQPPIIFLAHHRRQSATSFLQLKKPFLTNFAVFTPVTVIGDFIFAPQVQGCCLDGSEDSFGLNMEYLPYATKDFAEVHLVFRKLLRFFSFTLKSVFSFHLTLLIEMYTICFIYSIWVPLRR